MIHLTSYTTPNLIYYCHAEENLPEGDIYDFREWIVDNDFHGLAIPGESHLVYSPQLIREYLQMRGIPFEEIIEDRGVVVTEIRNQARGLSRLEIMD